MTILSTVNTLFEKLIALQLNAFFENNSIICPQQHGFIAGRSTAITVSALSQFINTALNKQDIAVSIFLDVRKAFDTICHARLFEKLETYGVVGNALQFIQSYFHARGQQVVINKHG